MKIVRLSSGGTDRERRDEVCSKMNNTILVLHSTFHLNKAFVQHDHRIETVDVWHHNNVGVACLMFQGQKNEALGKAPNCSRVAPASSCACKLLRPAEQRAGPAISVIPPQGIPPIAVSMTLTPVGIVRISISGRCPNAAGTRSASRASTCARVRAEENI